jgi:hypothetical protein
MNNRTGYAVKCGDEYVSGFDALGPTWTAYRLHAVVWQDRSLAVETLLLDCVGLRGSWSAFTVQLDFRAGAHECSIRRSYPTLRSRKHGVGRQQRGAHRREPR